MVPEHLSDEELVALVQRGEHSRFGELMARYESKLHRYGSKFLAREGDISDIVQDVFVRAFENIQGFDASQRFSPWIYRIAHNAFANELRRRSRNPIVLPDFDLIIGNLPSEESAQEEGERSMLSRMVEDGLKRIAPKYREVLVLYFMEELSYKEIADVLHVPVGTVGVRLARAKQSLKAVYDARNVTYEQ